MNIFELTWHTRCHVVVYPTKGGDKHVGGKTDPKTNYKKSRGKIKKNMNTDELRMQGKRKKS